MYADPLAERVWSRLGGTHTSRGGTVGARPREPLSNTPGIASVGEKKERKKLCPRMAQLASHGSYESYTHALPTVWQSADNGEATEPFKLVTQSNDMGVAILAFFTGVLYL
jgi:hypothetical protein